jgi:hypothetical protein
VLADDRSDLYADWVGIDVEPVDDHHAASARLRFDIGLMAGPGPADRHRSVGQIGGAGK